jgi:hypothetical protein
MRPYQRETIVVGMFNSFKSWNIDSFTSGRDPPRLFPVWPPLSLPVWPPRAVRFVSSHPAAASASSPPRPRRLVFSRFGRRERRARLRLFPSGHCERCGWSFPVRPPRAHRLLRPGHTTSRFIWGKRGTSDRKKTGCSYSRL